MIVMALKNEFREYKTEIGTLEKTVKRWKDGISEIDHLSQECYNSFNNLHMNIAKLQDLKQREQFEKNQYKETYKFLVFVENEMNADLYVLLANNLPSFKRLINHWNKYCSRMEAKYDIELDSEINLRAEKKLKKK